MPDPCLTAVPAGDPVDLRHLEAALSNLRRAERDIATIATYLDAARNRLMAAPDDPEARRAVRMAELRMRADATALALQFAGLAQPDGAAP